jgi:hypothetical protein
MRLTASLSVALFLVECVRPSAPARAVKAGPPPFKVSFRKSQIPGQGLVANVNNKSSTESIKIGMLYLTNPSVRRCGQHQ